MDIRQLRYFIAVAEEGNFSRAAERLHISQPPLSQQIKSLEASLGVILFERGRLGARLTRAGEALLTRARDIVADLDSTRKMVLRVADGLEGYLRIGIINSVMYGPLPRTMRLFQERNPAVEWTLHEMLPDPQGEALVRGQIDVGFASSATGREELRSIRVYPQPLMAAVPTDDAHVINVSAMEGQFYRTFKSARHPHTNMAKAALNMMTRTVALDFGSSHEKVLDGFCLGEG